MREHQRNLQSLLEDLTGKKAPDQFTDDGFLEKSVLDLVDREDFSIGFSQFNEILLSFGYDRLEHGFFFQFLIDGSTEFKPESQLTSLEDLEEGIKRFRKLALIRHGNIRFAYKLLKNNKDLLDYYIEIVFDERDVREFTDRNPPIHPIDEIEGTDTYYLGYLVDKEDLSAEEIKKRDEIRDVGKKNYQSYLASDHLDVYIATSMRERHEYYQVHKITGKIFSHEELKDLKIRFFDPTQAYCKERIDKGLFEALMLKRARCTIYFAQETDTLGKDSELASTLAQGKAVIAFVPKVDQEYFSEWYDDLQRIEPEKSEAHILLNQLRVFDSKAAWNNDSPVREWISNPDQMDIEEAQKLLYRTMKSHYDTRAATLSEVHPLGIQVNLETGVANGVLVVRDVDTCARLVKCIITYSIDFSFDIHKETETGTEKKYIYLRERISNCIFRVQTGDDLLTNTFWNYYID